MGRKPSLTKQVLAAIDKFTPVIRKGFFDAVSDITDNVRLQAIVDAIEAGDVVAAANALGMNQAALRPLTSAIEQAFETGGIIAADNFPRISDAKFRFDVRNSRAEAWLRDHSSRLVTSITESTRDGLRNALTIGMQNGRNPREVALDIVGRIGPNGKRVGGIIGLTPNQASWVANARAELADPKTASHWFQRTLRDKRFDRIVQNSINSGIPLDSDTIGRLTSRYSDSLLRMRGETIARTEALQSLNQSQDMAFRQAVDEGIIGDNAIKRSWDSAGDSRVRPSHVAMDGQAVGLNEAFTTPDGYKMMFPGDSSLGAPGSEIINCRCVVRHEVDFLSDPSLRDDPEPVVPPAPPPPPVVPPLPSPGGLIPRPTDPIPIQQVVKITDKYAEVEIGSVARSVIEQSHGRLPGYIERYANQALNSYVGSGYIRMNGYLRVKAKGVNQRGEPFKVDPAIEAEIADVEKLMKPSELSYAGYRGVRKEFVSEIEGKGVGDEFPMNGFTSVARASEVSLDFARAGTPDAGILFKFIVPKGTMMIPTNPGETELLLRSGNNFRILNIETREVPYRGRMVPMKVYSLEMIP